MTSCQVCGGQHAKPSVSCENCWGCLRLCERKPSCTFYNEANPIHTVQPDVIANAPDIHPATANIPKALRIEDTIRCWMLSSLGAKFPSINLSNDEVIDLARDFLDIMEEKLSMVDHNFDYFLIHKEEGGKRVEQVNSLHLFHNQNLDYILMDEHKRTNLGKKIAIMEKEVEDDSV